MKEILLAINSKVNALVWGPPMLIFLIGVGIYISVRTNFIQFARFGLMLKETLASSLKKGPRRKGT